MNVYRYDFTRHRVCESPARIGHPRDTLPVIRALIGENVETERLVVLWLDTRNAVIGGEVVYSGNVSASLVRVAELFRGAVRVSASGMILAHNHPSGDPMPSPDDLHVTSVAVVAARVLDIDLLDHVIIGEGDSFTSLRDRGVDFDRRVR
jgi:DNA repair protein RadC